MIVEYYRTSACGLLTYLFVRRDVRGALSIGGSVTNVAGVLLHSAEGMPTLAALMASRYGRLSAILFESNHPSRTALEDDSMPPHKRLGFFRRMGARRIPFDYVQPPLEASKGPVTNLMLYCFPRFQPDKERLAVATVMQFLMELSSSLDEQQDEPVYQGQVFLDDIARTARIATEGTTLEFHGVVVQGKNLLQEMYKTLLQRVDGGLEGEPTVRLVHVPLGEEPKLALPASAAVLALHAAVDEQRYEAASAEGLEKWSGPGATQAATPVWLCLPDVVEFDGADGVGDARCVLEEHTTQPADVGLDCFGRVVLVPARLWLQGATALADERFRCWHVALAPAAETDANAAPWSEGTVIKLTKLVSASAEHGAATRAEWLTCRILVAERDPAASLPHSGSLRPLADFLFSEEAGSKGGHGHPGLFAYRRADATPSIGAAFQAATVALSLSPAVLDARAERELFATWMTAAAKPDALALLGPLYGMATARLGHEGAPLKDAVSYLADNVCKVDGELAAAVALRLCRSLPSGEAATATALATALDMTQGAEMALANIRQAQAGGLNSAGPPSCGHVIRV